ncbi:hypothetical protein HDU76_011062 [Blyttiomyces sp. JEL0837]|nr:hypothetical protein HDU76_011062 [Blyttiomyces sp. JEL0837]
MQREYTPSHFQRVVDGSSHFTAVSKEGSTFQVQVLDHNIVRVRHLPPELQQQVPKDSNGTAVAKPLGGQLPQLSSHTVAAVDLSSHGLHMTRRASNNGPLANNNPIANKPVESATQHVHGLSRDRVSDRFPCPPPEIESTATGFTIRTDALIIKVHNDPNDGDVSLSWSSAAVPDSPFLEDLPHRAYPLLRSSYGARHFIRRRETDLHYGMGERASPLTLNGRRFRLETMDALGYDAKSTDPLYKLVPFSVTLDTATRQAYGVFYDSLSSGVADFGMEIDAFWGPYRSHTVYGGCGLDMYVVFGPTFEKCVESYTQIVGRPAMPPKYALGYLASAMGYAESENAQEQIEKLPELCRKWNVPCDMLHLSSGYTVDPNTGARNVFTWNKKRFPDPAKMITSLRNSGIRISSNIKPWLLCQHPDYNAVDARGGFVRDCDTQKSSLTRLWSAGGGDTARGSYFDLSSNAGRAYWKQGVRTLLDLGIESIWNDNNEYALPDDNDIYASSNVSGGPSTVGSAGRGLQTMLMASASFEAMVERYPNRRPYLITRSGVSGIQRFACQTWSGDNFSSWDTLQHNVPMGLNAGLSGLVGYGHDVGGFVGPRPEKELFVSWKQEGVTEPWMYPDVLPIIRDAIHLRYKLLPYMYNLHHEASRTGHPVIRPLVYQFQLDPTIQSSSFEFMLGPSLLVASVYEKGATTRKLKLPSGDPWCDFWTGEWHHGGRDIVLSVPLERCGGLLAHAGAMISTGPVFNYVGQPNADNERVVLCFPVPFEGTAKIRYEGILIEDDGETRDAPTSEIKLFMEVSKSDVVVDAHFIKNDFSIGYKVLWFVLPFGDKRSLKTLTNKNVQKRKGDDGREQIGLLISELRVVGH